MKQTVYTIVWFASLFFCFAFILPVSTSEILTEDIQKAIAEDQWIEVFQKFQKNIANEPNYQRDAPVRFIYGHAALVTGKNSISTRQFYCACDSSGSESLNAWNQFTINLKDTYPKSSAARYLLADSYARLGMFDRAKDELDTALIFNKNHIPSLNARAVIQWLLYENSDPKEDAFKLAALSDIHNALKIKTDMADLYANKAIFVMRNTGNMENAREDLEEALRIDPSYWLAMNSYAVTYGEEGDRYKYEDMIKKVMDNEPNTPFVDSNAGENNGKLKTGERGFAMSGGLKFDVPGLNKMIKANINFSYDQQRGGIFTYLKEGENVILTPDDEPVIIGTWFNYNYPNEKIH